MISLHLFDFDYKAEKFVIWQVTSRSAAVVLYWWGGGGGGQLGREVLKGSG